MLMHMLCMQAKGWQPKMQEHVNSISAGALNDASKLLTSLPHHLTNYENRSQSTHIRCIQNTPDATCCHLESWTHCWNIKRWTWPKSSFICSIELDQRTSWQSHCIDKSTQLKWKTPSTNKPSSKTLTGHCNLLCTQMNAAMKGGMSLNVSRICGNVHSVVYM